MNTQHLIERFADARLPLEVATSPFVQGRGAEHIFAMDIRRRHARNARSEHFVAWPGHDDNLVVVQGLDEGERQLVLLVREPKRDFFEPVPRWMWARKRPGWREDVAKRANVQLDDVVVDRDEAFVRRETPNRKRHFLAGRDERQLFMCRLPRACTTVRQAHEALRAPQVKDARSAIERSIRQGEWFFLVPTDSELDELERAIAGHRSWVRRKVSIGSVIPRAGKPHVADELVVHTTKSGVRVYVRGAVRHLDHNTIHLDRWRQVVRNREVDEGRSVFGGSWID